MPDTVAGKKLLDARLSEVQWDAVLEVVREVGGEMASERKAGAAAVFTRLTTIHHRAQDAVPHL